MFEEIEPVFVFIVLVWTSASSTLAFGQAANKIRDEVLLGKIGQEQMDYQHRLAKFHNDWLPTKAAGAVLCFVYVVALVVAPSVVELPSSIKIAMFASSIVPFIGLLFFTLGIRDYRLIRRTLGI